MRDHIGRHRQCTLKPCDHHGIDVDHVGRFVHLVDTHAGHPDGEVQQVVDDKRQQDQAGNDHGFGTETGLQALDLDVAFRSRGLVLQGQLNPEKDVNGESCQHNKPEDPDEWSETVQLLRVSVDCVSTKEQGRVAQQVHTNKRDQHDAGNGHDDLSAHRTLRQLHDFDPLLNVL